MVLVEVTLWDIDGQLVHRYQAQGPLRVGSVVALPPGRWTVIRVDELLADGSWTQSAFVDQCAAASWTRSMRPRRASSSASASPTGMLNR